MNDFQDDEALARLRAADPATGAHPDLHRISERLRGRTPLGTRTENGYQQASSGYSFSDSSTAVYVSDPGTRTNRSGLLVAASVAALAFGGGGYVLGTSLADGADGPSGGTAAGTATADGPEGSEAGQREGSSAELLGSSDAASGEAWGGDDGDASMGYESSSGGYYGPVIPIAGDNLSTEPTTGAVYAVDQSGERADTRQILSQYAEGLGIEGDLEDGGDYASIVDSTDGRSLNIYTHGGGTNVDYSNPAVDPYCEDYQADIEASGGGWFGPGGPETITCLPAGDRPSDEAAIASAQDFLDSAGIDYSGYEFTVDMSYYGEVFFGSPDSEGHDEASATSTPDSSAITAAPEDVEKYLELMGAQGYGDEARDVAVIARSAEEPVKGYRSWHFSVTDQGISYASIQQGEFVSLGDYPVISPAEAVERVSDTRFQQIGAYIPDLEYEAMYYEEEWTEPDPLPQVTPGDPIPYPITESQVTSAELHTGVVGLWDGTEFLAPVYNLTDDQGNSWQVLGLAEEALDFTP